MSEPLTAAERVKDLSDRWSSLIVPDGMVSREIEDAILAAEAARDEYWRAEIYRLRARVAMLEWQRGRLVEAMRATPWKFDSSPWGLLAGEVLAEVEANQ